MYKNRDCTFFVVEHVWGRFSLSEADCHQHLCVYIGPIVCCAPRAVHGIIKFPTFVFVARLFIFLCKLNIDVLSWFCMEENPIHVVDHYHFFFIAVRRHRQYVFQCFHWWGAFANRSSRLCVLISRAINRDLWFGFSLSFLSLFTHRTVMGVFLVLA